MNKLSLGVESNL